MREYPSSEIITVFTKQHKVSSAFSKRVAELPRNTRSILRPRSDTFGGMICGKVVAGHYKDTDVHEYKVKQDRWVPIHGEREDHLHSDRDNAKACVVGKVCLLCGGFLQTNVEILRFDLEVEGPTKNLRKKPKYPRTFSPTPLPFSPHHNHTVTRVGENKVILVGGYVETSYTNDVFQGELIENENDVKWTRLASLPPKKERFGHVAFKMKGSLYIAGGMSNNELKPCCLRYDMEGNKWFESPHSLPYPLRNASVFVSADESFAVITGGLAISAKYNAPKSIIPFAEESGFQLLKNFSMRENRSHHVCVEI